MLQLLYANVMDEMQKTSFKSYRVCNICKISHNLHTKHLYSRRHTQRVEQLLKKSIAKVSLAKSKAATIEIHDEDWQKEEKFWCYFCSGEFLKHFRHNSLMVCCLGLINHLTGQEHYESVKKFLITNRKNSDSVEKYILKKSELNSLLNHLPEAEAQYLKKMEHLHLKDVAHVSSVERERKELVDRIMFQDSIASNSSESCSKAISSSISQTSSAVASSSNCPLQSSSNQHMWGGRKTRVNISNADSKIPPWLLPDDGEPVPVTTVSLAPVIGPTINDLVKHVEKQKKKGLNPKRVGATFNHKAITSSNWLPSFGRVWNQGRRKQSRLQYERERKNI